MAIISATLFDPWRVEEWAHEVLAVDRSSEIAFRMARSYLKVVDSLIPANLIAGATPQVQAQIGYKREALIREGQSPDPLYYWGKALEWQKIVHRQPDRPQPDPVDQLVESRRNMVEIYQKRQENPGFF